MNIKRRSNPHFINMNGGRRSLPAFLLAMIIPAFFLVFCSRDKQAPQVKKIPVTLAKVEKREISRPLHIYGRLAANKEVKLSFKTGGIIREIYVEESQRVEADRLLAGLDLQEIESGVSMARSGFDKAKRDLERVKNLYDDRAATLEQYQDVQTAFQAAQAQLGAAEFNLRFSEIRAPFAGRILKRLAEENELVGPGMPVFLFGSAAASGSEWVVRAGVSDQDLVRLRPGDTAAISFDAFPGIKFNGSISKIAEAPDPLTGTYEIESTLRGVEKKLVSGLIARVDIFPGDKSSYFIIPVESLVDADGDEGRVFAVDGQSGTARRITVRVGFLFEDKIAVLSGLEGVDQVVVEGASYLVDGSAVEVAPGDSSPTGTTEQDR